MAWIPDGEKISKISLSVLAQFTNATDAQTDRQTDGHRVTAIAALCIASHGKKIAVFTYRSPHFCFPWRRLCDYHPTRANMFYGRKDNLLNACQTPRSMYLSIFNGFLVIRCLSQCVSPKIAIFTTFWFPLGTPLGQSRKCCMDGKRIRCLQIVSLHVPI